MTFRLPIQPDAATRTSTVLTLCLFLVLDGEALWYEGGHGGISSSEENTWETSVSPGSAFARFLSPANCKQTEPGMHTGSERGRERKVVLHDG